MCYLLDKARKDYNVVKELYRINDEMYLDICCYHIQQAIEKILKCSIELKGSRYEFTHNIARLYQDFIACGWEEIRDLQLMAGTLTDWEAGSRYKESFFATTADLQTAMELYQTLEEKIKQYLEDLETEEGDNK